MRRPRRLRELTHHRHALVKAHTASAYRIHHLVDQLLPGFLDEKQSGLTPFTDASLWLMGQGLSPRLILSKKSEVLAEKLALFMVRNTEDKVKQLKTLPQSAPPALNIPAHLRDAARVAVLFPQQVGDG